MAVSDAHVFSGFLTPVLTHLFFPKLPTTFLTCFCRGETPKYAGKKVRLNRGIELTTDRLTTKPPGPVKIMFYDTGRFLYFCLTLYCTMATLTTRGKKPLWEKKNNSTFYNNVLYSIKNYCSI